MVWPPHRLARTRQYSKDVIRFVVLGPDSGNFANKLEEVLLEPFLLWVRTTTGQWWAGRSYEAISGALQMVLPVKEDSVLGAPIPIVRTKNMPFDVSAITDSIWKDLWEKTVRGSRPRISDVLLSDCAYQAYCEEWRTAIILANCAIESARDEMLCSHSLSMKNFSKNRTDLLKHLGKDLKSLFGISFAEVSSEESREFIKSLWITRGEASHGRELRWREGNDWKSVKSLSERRFLGSLRTVIQTIRSFEMRATLQR